MKKYQIFCIADGGDFSLDGMAFNTEEEAQDYLEKYTDKCLWKYPTESGVGCLGCISEFIIEENDISKLMYLWLKINRKIK